MGENTNTAVVDASFLLAYLLPDERSATVDAIIKRFITNQLVLRSSSVLLLEVLNGLRSSVVRRRITKSRSLRIAEQFLSLRIDLVQVDYARAYHIGLQHDLSLYDASYVEVATHNGGTLLTLDSKLQQVSSTL